MRSRVLHEVRTFGAPVALAALLAVGLVLHHRPRTLTAGDRLPAIELRDLSGDTVQLNDRPSTSTAVYNVFTSWCTACNQELPEITRAAAVLERHGVEFVGIDQGETPVQVARYAAANDVHYTLLMDRGRLTTSRLGARIIPETLIVRDGVVQQIIVGPTTTSQVLAAAGIR